MAATVMMSTSLAQESELALFSRGVRRLEPVLWEAVMFEVQCSTLELGWAWTAQAVADRYQQLARDATNCVDAEYL